MANNYPTSLNNYAVGTNSATLAAAGHAAEHNALEAKVGINGSGDITSIDYLLKNTASKNPGHFHTNGGPTYLVAASDAPAFIKNKADYVCTGTADDVQIQAAVNALPVQTGAGVGGGSVQLSQGTFFISSTIQIFLHCVTLRGMGVMATRLIGSSAALTLIQLGNRQSDGIMRNWMQLSDMTVDNPGGASSVPVVIMDGGGRGSTLKRIRTDQGGYGVKLLDIDRCVFEEVDCNNPRIAAMWCATGLENTWGTCQFINCSQALSDNNSSGWLWKTNTNQASPNAFDRISIVGNLFYATVGLTGTVGLDLQVGATAFSVIGALFENNLTHVSLAGANNQVCQLGFIGCSFIQNSGNSTNIFLFNTLNHSVTIQDCRLQQATNGFNGASGFSSICFLGHSTNQGNITNLFTGSFGNRQGTDTVFAGDTNLVSGLDNKRYATIFANALKGNPVAILPSNNSTTGIQLQTSQGVAVVNVDTSGKFVGINTTSPAYSLDINGDINMTVNNALRFATASVLNVSSGSTRLRPQATGQEVQIRNFADNATNVHFRDDGRVGIGIAAGTPTLLVQGATATVAIALTDAATIATDAKLGNFFTVTLGGNRTLSAPTNPTSGQRILLAIRQDATGSRTLALGSGIAAGPFTVTLTLTANKTDYLELVYDIANLNWDVINFQKGY